MANDKTTTIASQTASDAPAAADTAGVVRRGWRAFECGCGYDWEWPSRDCFSPSGEDCPQCGEWVTPSESRPDASIPCDSFGNITIQWDSLPAPSKVPVGPKPVTWSNCVDSAAWLAAAKLCTTAAAFFSDNPELGLYLLCNDIFAPGADAEPVPVECVHEVLALANSVTDWRLRYRPLMEWVEGRRGYAKGTPWFIDRKKTPSP